MKQKLWPKLWAAFSVLLVACAYNRPITTPMQQVNYPALADLPTEQKQLLIFLPGIGGKLSDFERYDFIRLLQEKYPAMDVKLLDAHFSYYRQSLIVNRLHNEVILPAKAQGYCQIHLAGISLGGYGALLYLREQGDTLIDSISLLAPYLGEPKHYAHLLDASKTAQDSDNKLNIWPWLTRLTETQKQLLYLAYGEQDRLVDGQNLLAGLLASDHSFTMAGKHRWPVWRSLWQKGLSTNKLLPATTCP